MEAGEPPANTSSLGKERLLRILGVTFGVATVESPRRSRASSNRVCGAGLLLIAFLVSSVENTLYAVIGIAASYPVYRLAKKLVKSVAA